MAIYETISDTGFVIGKFDPHDEFPDPVDSEIVDVSISKGAGTQKVLEELAAQASKKVTAAQKKAKKVLPSDDLGAYRKKRQDRIKRAAIKRDTKMPADLAWASLPTSAKVAAVGVPAALLVANNEQANRAFQRLKGGTDRAYGKARDTRHYRPASPYYDDYLGKSLDIGGKRTARLERKASAIEARTTAKGKLAVARARKKGSIIKPPNERPSEYFLREASRFKELLPKSTSGKVALAAGIPATAYALNKSYGQEAEEILKAWIAKAGSTNTREKKVPGKNPSQRRKAYLAMTPNQQGKHRTPWLVRAEDFGRKISDEGPRKTGVGLKSIAGTAGKVAEAQGGALATLALTGGGAAATSIAARRQAKATRAAQAAEAAKKAARNKAAIIAGLASLPAAVLLANRKPVEKSDAEYDRYMEELDKSAKDVFRALRHGRATRRYNRANPQAPLEEYMTPRQVRRHNKSLHPDQYATGKVRYGARRTPAAVAPKPAPTPPAPPKKGFWDQINEGAEALGNVTRNVTEGYANAKSAITGKPIKRRGMSGWSTGQKVAVGGAAAGGLYVGNKLREPRPARYQMM